MNRLGLFVVGGMIALNAQAREWDARADLLSSGAAASVVVAQVCQGAPGVQRAISFAQRRLSALVQELGPPSEQQTIALYLWDSTNRKIRALLQANEHLACRGLDNLRAVATGTGFPAP